MRLLCYPIYRQLVLKPSKILKFLQSTKYLNAYKLSQRHLQSVPIYRNKALGVRVRLS